MGFDNPLKENWFLNSILKGIGTVKGLSVKRKLPITPQILLNIKQKLNLNNPKDAVFWAACLVAFLPVYNSNG